jgi:hypothetical protein
MLVAVLLWNAAGLHSAFSFFPALACLLVLLGNCTERQLPFYRRMLGQRAV